jgi:hypothetical protein
MSVRKDMEALRLPEVFSGKAEDFAARRAQIAQLLAQEEYGFLPDVPYAMGTEDVPSNRLLGGGTAENYVVKMTVTMNGRSHTFPLYCVVPTENRPAPAILLINFRPGVPDEYLPAEEIADNGFAVFSLCYNDVTKDDDDFTDGLAGLYYNGRERGPSDPGKISLWAWAASRAIDYILTLTSVDHRNLAVAGHSRLGKTAMWTAVNDPRVTMVFANESGCSGSTLARGVADEAEHVWQICQSFPYWFCKNYRNHAHHEEEMPFDQHFPLAAIAPRRLYIGLAKGDYWTDADSSYRAIVAAAPVYEALGCIPGCSGPDERYPEIGDRFHDGYIGVHMRSGDHFLSRRDWLGFMAYYKRYMAR